jgi:FeS assembly SUF system protein
MNEPYKHPNSIASLPVVPDRADTHPPHLAASPSVQVPAAKPPGADADRPKTIEQKLLEGKIIAAISQVYDPEIPVNVYELGLIYGIDIADDNSVKVRMTLTAPGCPVAGSLPAEVERKVEAVDGVKEAEVELVWEPAWDKSRMSEAAMLQLGF